MAERVCAIRGTHLTRKTSPAKGEVGVRDRKPTQTLRRFAVDDFLPFVTSTFAARSKINSYYRYGVKSLLAYDKLADEPPDSSRPRRSPGIGIGPSPSAIFTLRNRTHARRSKGPETRWVGTILGTPPMQEFLPI
jgi:hypothetical protein